MNHRVSTARPLQGFFGGTVSLHVGPKREIDFATHTQKKSRLSEKTWVQYSRGFHEGWTVAHGGTCRSKSAHSFSLLFSEVIELMSSITHPQTQ